MQMFKKFKLVKILTIIACLILANTYFVFAGSAEIQNLTISPDPVANDSPITISFEIRGDAVNGDECFFVTVGSVNTYNGDDDSCRQQWLADETGIYQGYDTPGTTYWWLDGVSQTASGMTSTDYRGSDGGLCTGNGTTWRRVDIITHIAPEMSGNYYIGVGTREHNHVSDGCCNYNQELDSSAFTSFTVTGTPLIKIDLLQCNDNSVVDGVPECSNNEIKIRLKLINHGESGVWIENFEYRYCFYDTDTSYDSQSSTNFNMSYAAGPGPGFCNPFNPQGEAVITTETFVDCGDDRWLNHCFKLTFENMPQRPYMIPPGGGYIEGGSPTVWFRRTGSRCWDTSDDYSRVTELEDCPTYGDQDEVPLYYGGTHVCEYEDYDHEDAETGLKDCYTDEDCGDWGYLDIDKSITNGTEFMIGDTVTYCITVTNTSGSTVTFNIWDTIPDVTEYRGCDNSCSTSGGDTVVYWTITNLASDASATRCFWVEVTDYPTNLPEKHSVFAYLNEYIPY